jgi:hypothetical protein
MIDEHGPPSEGPREMQQRDGFGSRADQGEARHDVDAKSCDASRFAGDNEVEYARPVYTVGCCAHFGRAFKRVADRDRRLAEPTDAATNGRAIEAQRKLEGPAPCVRINQSLRQRIVWSLARHDQHVHPSATPRARAEHEVRVAHGVEHDAACGSRLQHLSGVELEVRFETPARDDAVAALAGHQCQCARLAIARALGVRDDAQCVRDMLSSQLPNAGKHTRERAAGREETRVWIGHVVRSSPWRNRLA